MRTLIVIEYDIANEGDDLIEKIKNHIAFQRQFTVEYIERSGVTYARVSHLVEWQSTKGTSLLD